MIDCNITAVFQNTFLRFFSYDILKKYTFTKKGHVSMQKLIELNDIGYSYHSLQGETKALQNISFGVTEGEFLAVVGPSGCGKSTLLSIIAGLIRPETGTITVNNPDGSLHYPRIGYMLQHDHLFEWRTIYQNAILGLEINHMMTEERLAHVEQLFRDYELYPFKEKRPSELSGGMKQRAALIRTLALDPQLLLLDEPFSALDYQTRLMVSSDICRLIRAAGKTMIIITHDIAEAISIADRVLILSGRPATVSKELPIRLTIKDASPLAARNAPEFPNYFKQIWEELSNENK